MLRTSLVYSWGNVLPEMLVSWTLGSRALFKWVISQADAPTKHSTRGCDCCLRHRRVVLRTRHLNTRLWLEQM